MKQHTASDIVFKSDLSTRARIVFMYLSYRSNKENTCFPAIKTIARECGMGVSTVKRALNDLLENGYVQKDPRFRDDNGQTSNLYTLVEEKAVDVQSENTVELLDSGWQEDIAHGGEIEETLVASDSETLFSADATVESSRESELLWPWSDFFRDALEGVQYFGNKRDSRIRNISGEAATFNVNGSYPTGEPPPSSIMGYR